MLDFVKISTVVDKKGHIKIYPTFQVTKTRDLMVRGGVFYAVWDEAIGLWSTDEYRCFDLIDQETANAYDEWLRNNPSNDETAEALYLQNFDSGLSEKWYRYIRKGLRDNYVPLDENIIFQNEETTRESYASKKLPYAISDGSCAAWDELVNTLYDSDEKRKIEWVIGSIATGASKTLQKFIVFYGSGGTGKSTILKIIDKMFAGYAISFDAKALGTINNTFSLEPFKSNPLVAIDHDSKLDKIEDNTKINSLVSHERMVVNEKHKNLYEQAFSCMLLIGTNNPVKITDAKSGIIRRLIDVSPTGKLVPKRRYLKLLSDIDFELGAIVNRCINIFKDDPSYYDDYIAINMIESTNHMYNFVLDNFNELNTDDYISLSAAFDLYKRYCEDSGILYPMGKMAFKSELKNYYENFEVRSAKGYNLYSGFITDKFMLKNEVKEEPEEKSWLELSDNYISAFNELYSDCPAQYATDDKPRNKWAKVTTVLKDIKQQNRTHFVKLPINHIFIDFDLKDENGNKSLEKNIEAANRFPPTYAETSKGGCGLHLHYIYTGDVDQLETLYSKNIEIKTCKGNAAVRRRLTLCNDLPISTISSGLPLKERKKMINEKTVKDERELKAKIAGNLLKKYCGATKPSVDFIKTLLDEAYEAGIPYDVTDMRPDIMQFALSSTNNSEYCAKVVAKMKFKSEQEPDNIPFPEDAPIIFFDVEVFPNLFVICYKKLGSKNTMRLINPSPSEVRALLSNRLVGFNCRRYDNHIIFAASEGYTPKELFEVSQRIINKSANAFFGQAWNLSYTDVYDFASAAHKQSLKKWEIELGIHHQELGLKWDEEVPEDLWETVAEYCVNDVVATEAVWNHLQPDFMARQILADLTGMSVNDTTNTLSTKLIFGDEKHPQENFNYRNLGERVGELDTETYNFIRKYFPAIHDYNSGQEEPFSRIDVDGKLKYSILPWFPGYIFEAGKSTYKGIEVGEGGRVWAEPGMYYNALVEDAVSMHPTSAINECLFGPKYTQIFADLREARVCIKHSDWERLGELMDGKFKDYIPKIESGEISAKDLSTALKTVINSVYGLTAAAFDNPFRDPRNVDNIVAKRGALFMIDLQEAVEKKFFKPVHVKTDSMKVLIENGNDEEITKFIHDFAYKYGYEFEREATYERMCLVNNAVYIARTYDGKWTATGKEFAVPYIFKTLFSHEELDPHDLAVTFNCNTSLYLDFNENLKEDEHDYKFVGRTGLFYPIRPGMGGGELYREKEGKYYYPSGAKGYHWMEAEIVDSMDNGKDLIDIDYWEEQATEVKKTIEKFGSFEEFVNV